MSGDRTADVARLADMLAERRHSWDPDELRDIVADLQPVVDAIADERAEDGWLAADILLHCLDEVAGWDSAAAARHRDVGVREYAAGIARAYRAGRDTP